MQDDNIYAKQVTSVNTTTAIQHAPLSAAAVVTATGGTIQTAGLAISRVNPAGAITGVILQPGTINGQQIVVCNESGNSITMAAKATSNVQSGVTNVIPANAAATYIWDGSQGTPVWVCIGMGL